MYMGDRVGDDEHESKYVHTYNVLYMDESWFSTRVTRWGEFWPPGRLFSLGSINKQK
jgi:hypothetical protein